MGDYHLNYNLPSDEKFCKYSYASWCPTCERNSPRRRSKSETNECRKKCREMKSSCRKYSKCQEYENMELQLDYHSKDLWYEMPRENYRHTRSNQLCELPTSYIANNCQSSKIASEYVEKNLKSYEISTMNHEDPAEVLSYCKTKHLASLQRKSKDATWKYQHNCYDNHLSFDTSTYFDTVHDTSNLHEHFVKEMEFMRERISCCNGARKKVEVDYKRHIKHTPTQYDLMHQKEYEVDGEVASKRLNLKLDIGNDFISINQSEIGPRPKKIAVKTRKMSASKIRKFKQPTKLPQVGLQTSTGFVKSSDYSGSDGEDDESEEVNGDGESEGEDETTCQEMLNGADAKNSSRPLGNGDGNSWPVRASLFPHVPPYIKFNTHDAEVPVRMPTGCKLFKWQLSKITPIVVRKTLTNSGFIMVRKSNQWLGTWGKHMKSPMFKTLKESQKLNHFPGTFQLGRKDRLWRNFQRFINRYGYKEFGFIPQTFILPQELKILKQNWEYKNGSAEDAWIIKPPASARGVGIKVINKWSQLPKKMSLVVQKYISNPYLINGSKFDLRLYVLVTSFNPLRIYLYPNGLARFASAKYSENAKDLKDPYVHLTNYSINKLSSQYTANDDANACQGHKWTITKLLEYLSKQGVDTKALWHNLQQLVIKTIITGEAPIDQLCEKNILSRYNCYELFGIDVLLDEQLKPWLLEVNISPSLHSSSPLDAYVKGPLVQTLFDLAQFHFPARLSQSVHESPVCYDPKLYTTALTKKEREKHNIFEQYECREDYLEDILLQLTGDDVRMLTQAEDELTVKGCFERIFPTSNSYKYLNFMEHRYYNKLFDAWESRFEKDRDSGVELLRSLCAKKVHLKVAPKSTLNKNSQNTNHGSLNLQPSREGQSRPLIEILQDVTIKTSLDCN